MKNRLKGFTLIEIMVGLMILAIITTISATLFREMWSMKQLAASQYSQVSVELMLKTLRNDLKAGLIERDGTKNINFLSQDGDLAFHIQRPLVDAKTKKLFFETVTWTFSETKITRKIGNDTEPLKISAEKLSSGLSRISDDVAYLRLNFDGRPYNLVIDTR